MRRHLYSIFWNNWWAAELRCSVYDKISFSLMKRTMTAWNQLILQKTGKLMRPKKAKKKVLSLCDFLFEKSKQLEVPCLFLKLTGLDWLSYSYNLAFRPCKALLNWRTVTTENLFLLFSVMTSRACWCLRLNKIFISTKN